MVCLKRCACLAPVSSTMTALPYHWIEAVLVYLQIGFGLLVAFIQWYHKPVIVPLTGAQIGKDDGSFTGIPLTINYPFILRLHLYLNKK